MTIFLYKDGLVRLASEKYTGSKNMQDVYVHLTNYSLNKKNNNFDNELLFKIGIDFSKAAISSVSVSNLEKEVVILVKSGSL